jgi:hypothetical protein
MGSCEHLLGPISPRTKLRTCIRCQAKVPAEGTFTVTTTGGSMDIYSASIFSQWTGEQIRKFLNLRAEDIMLHNWHDDNLYVFHPEQQNAGETNNGT